MTRSRQPDRLPPYDRSILVPGPLDASTTRLALRLVEEALLDLPDDEFTGARIKRSLSDVCSQLGITPRDLNRPLSSALTGKPGYHQPAPLAAKLGKAVTLDRLRQAIIELSTVA